MIMIRTLAACALAAMAFVGTTPVGASPTAAYAAGGPNEPRWDKAVTTTHADLRQVFMLDGIHVRIDRIHYVAAYADGTPPDEGTRLLEIEYWAHNPEPTNADFYERFYAYAVMSNDTDTDGEGLSYYPLDSATEFEDVTLKPGMTLHARFFLEVPASAALSKLVLFGPVDGAKVTITAPARM